MATVKIPLLLKNFTRGDRAVDVPGSTLQEIIAALDERYPGLGNRLREDGQLSPTVAVTVDGKIATQGLATPVAQGSEICLLPSLGGG